MAHGMPRLGKVAAGGVGRRWNLLGRQRRVPPPQRFSKGSQADPYAALDGLQAVDKPVMFAFTDETVDRVFVAIGQATGLTITVEAKGDRKINVQTGRVPLKDALVQIGNENGLVYDVIGPDRMIVRDRVPRPE